MASQSDLRLYAQESIMSLPSRQKSLVQYHFRDNDGTYDLLAFNEMREHFKLIHLKLLETDIDDSDDDKNLTVDQEHLLTAKLTLKGEDLSLIIVGDQNLRSEILDFIYLKRYAYVPHHYQRQDSQTQFASLIQIHSKSGHYYAYYSYYRRAVDNGHNHPHFQTQIHFQFEKELDTLWLQLSPHDRDLILVAGVHQLDEL